MDSSVRHVAEISRLSTLERTVAGVLAIVGQPVSFEWLHWVVAACGIEATAKASMSEGALAACVDRLVAVGWVVERPECFRGHRWVWMPVAPALGLLRGLEREHALAGLLERIVARVQSVRGAWDEASPGRARVAAIRKDWPGVTRACAAAKKVTKSGRWVAWLMDALGDEPEREWLHAIPESLRAPYCRALLKAGVEALAPCCEGVLAYVRESTKLTRQDRLAAARFLVLAGRREEAASFPNLSAHGRDVIAFLNAFWGGEYDEALRLGDAAVARRSGKPLAGLEGVCHALMRIYAGGLGVGGAWDAVEASLADGKRTGSFTLAWSGVGRLLRWAKGESTIERAFWRDVGWLDALVHGVAYGGREREAPPALARAVQTWWHIAEEQAYVPLVQELAAVRRVLAGGQPVEGTLTAACRVRPAWEQTLDELEGLGERWGGDAPNLAVQHLGDAARAELIEAAGPKDVLVCSYGVLVAEASRLSERRFATLIVDEAHAVKNASTRRARAVFGIDAGFRLALTGTPIENHLGELWSVMEAAVPGLLGEQRDYLERFAKPIIEGDRELADTLRELVRPFILRRTREQVLEDLPPCTEIVVTIDPRPEEEAYYEALRRRAEQEVRRQRERRRDDGIALLAEITRLRRAAIDPRLLDSEAPAGAKLDAVVAQVETLRKQGHRVLVFTQFLGSMGLLRQRFEAAGIGYLELEGSTSAKVRAERIEAFQRGEGDVFLMSLRAGGVGVNLTGADYVIHVDPWWNPAVEDQATARAHRMGQTRPVTVYRMVTRGTIEERILELHEKKRHLAEDILEGMERSRKLTLDELRGLLGG